MADEPQARANQVKGEFPLTVGADIYTLKLDVNQLCVIEGMVSLKSTEIANRLGTGDLRLLRTVLWVAMQPHHPNVSVEDAGDVIMDLSPLVTQSKLIEAIANAFPPLPKTPPRPRKPART